ncbi:MAG: hypothetical protein U0W24_25335 [Bacteroidales bacterium]
MKENMENKTNEIDLIELLQKIGDMIRNGLNKLGNLLMEFLVLLVKKSLWIIGFTILGACIGFFLFSLTKRYYTSEMMARSNAVDNSIVINAINQLNELCLNNNRIMLAQYLGTDIESATKVKSIKAFYAIDNNKDGFVDEADYENTYNPSDTTKKRSNYIFYLKVEVFDEKVFPIVNHGTKKYINQSPYVSLNDSIRKVQALNMINYYNNEIQKLDSLQKTYYYRQMPAESKNNQMIILNEKEIKLVHSDIINLNRAKLDLERSLQIDIDPITVLQDFTVLSREENPWTKYVKMFGILFAVLGFVLSLIWEHRRRICEIIRQNQ